MIFLFSCFILIASPLFATDVTPVSISESDIAEKVIKTPELSCWPNHDFGGMQIPSETAKRLSLWIRESPTLERLGFRHAFIGEEALDGILTAVADCKHLQALDLASVGLKDRHAKLIGHLLSQRAALKSLDVSFNSFTIKGMKLLLGAFYGAKQLENLTLVNLYLDQECWELMEDALTSLQSLKSLDLTGVAMGVDGLKRLVAGLAFHHRVQEVGLAYNNLAVRESGGYLAEMIHLSSITSLDLRAAGITNNVLEGMAEVLRSYQTPLQEWKGQKPIPRKAKSPQDVLLTINLQNNLVSKSAVAHLLEAFGPLQKHIRIII